VTQTILEQLPRLQSDFVLRGYFGRQIDFSNDYNQLLEREAVREENPRKLVLIDGKNPPAKDYPHLKYNFKWFGGIFAIMAVAFMRWSK